jgi:hypothetical protein
MLTNLNLTLCHTLIQTHRTVTFTSWHSFHTLNPYSHATRKPCHSKSLLKPSCYILCQHKHCTIVTGVTHRLRLNTSIHSRCKRNKHASYPILRSFLIWFIVSTFASVHCFFLPLVSNVTNRYGHLVSRCRCSYHVGTPSRARQQTASVCCWLPGYCHHQLHNYSLSTRSYMTGREGELGKHVPRTLVSLVARSLGSSSSLNYVWWDWKRCQQKIHDYGVACQQK